MCGQRWFGREPALWIQGIAAVLAALVVFGVPGLNDSVAAAITGVLTAGAAAWTAWHVQPVAPSVFGALVSATVALLAALQVYDVTQQQAGAVQLAVAALVAILTRPQQEPTTASPGTAVTTVSGPGARPPGSPRRDWWPR